MKSTKLSRLEDFFSGSFTGVITRFIIAPLDVVKIRLQIQNIRYGTQKYKGTFQTMVQIGKEEGIQKLWSGNLTAEIYWFLYTGIQFSSYEAIQSYSNNIVHSSFLAGALSSSFTTLVTYPFDIMRTRFVYQADQKYYTHIASGMYSIGKTEGITGLYRGFLPCLVSVVPYMGSCFYILEFLKSKFGDSPTKNSIFGAISGACSKIIVYPLDTGKKILQVYRLAPERQSLSVFLHNHFERTGVRGLYAGVVAATLKSAISSSLLFGIYAFSKKFLHTHKDFDICLKQTLERKNKG